MAGRRAEGRGRLLSICRFKSVAVVVGPNEESYRKQDLTEDCVEKATKKLSGHSCTYCCSYRYCELVVSEPSFSVWC